MNYSYFVIGNQDGNKGDIPEFNIEIDEPEDDQKVDSPGPASRIQRARSPGLLIKERLEALIVLSVGMIIASSLTIVSCLAWAFGTIIFNEIHIVAMKTFM